LISALNDLINLPEWGGQCGTGYSLRDDGWCYPDSGIGDRYWNQTSDFSRIVFFFLGLAIILAILNFYTGYDTAYPGAFIYIMTIMVLILSSVNVITGQGYFYLRGATAGSYLCNYIPTTTACFASTFFDNYILFFLFGLLSLIYFFTTNKRYASG
jgi:hypothetical protein